MNHSGGALEEKIDNKIINKQNKCTLDSENALEQ